MTNSFLEQILNEAILRTIQPSHQSLNEDFFGSLSARLRGIKSAYNDVETFLKKSSLQSGKFYYSITDKPGESVDDLYNVLEDLADGVVNEGGTYVSPKNIKFLIPANDLWTEFSDPPHFRTLAAHLKIEPKEKILKNAADLRKEKKEAKNAKAGFLTIHRWSPLENNWVLDKTSLFAGEFKHGNINIFQLAELNRLVAEKDNLISEEVEWITLADEEALQTYPKYANLLAQYLYKGIPKDKRRQEINLYKRAIPPAIFKKYFGDIERFDSEYSRETPQSTKKNQDATDPTQSTINDTESREERSEPARSSKKGVINKIFNAAARLVVKAQQASSKLIQKNLRVDKDQAEEILDQLEATGIVSSSADGESYDVLIDSESELNNILSEPTTNKNNSEELQPGDSVQVKEIFGTGSASPMHRAAARTLDLNKIYTVDRIEIRSGQPRLYLKGKNKVEFHPALFRKIKPSTSNQPETPTSSGPVEPTTTDANNVINFVTDRRIVNGLEWQDNEYSYKIIDSSDAEAIRVEMKDIKTGETTDVRMKEPDVVDLLNSASVANPGAEQSSTTSKKKKKS